MVSSSSISICHLLLGYYPQIGGTEVQARRLACYQREQGHSVWVIACRRISDPTERRLPVYTKVDGIPVYRVSVRGEGHLAAWGYLLGGLRLLTRRARYCQIIHAHMFAAPTILGGLGGRLLGKKVVAKVSSGGTGDPRVRDNLSEVRRSLTANIRRLWLRTTVDRYLAISQGIAEELRKVGFPPEKIVQIPNGVDVHHFVPSEEPPEMLQPQLGLPVGPLITYTGRLRSRKNLGVFIRALPLLLPDFPALHLAIVGAGVTRDEEEQNRLERLSRDLGLAESVLFVKHTTDPLPYLQASSTFVIPSYKEGLSNAMLEAMAVGLPVVATPVSGAEDLIQSGANGVLLSADPTPEEVAEAILPLLNDPERAREMGRRARQTVIEQCSFEVVGEQILALYRTLLEA